MSWGIRLGGVLALNMGSLAYAQDAPVIPDGQSDTTVTYDDNGRALIDIADPVSDGISHNTFTQFNVTEGGLDFDNRFAGARTIISEVTGSERSLIEGDIEILGQRAHLFIANPNGILVDGSEFINTGGVALSTGRIDFVERVPAPFRTQLNTTLDVSRGEIVIGEGGLSGAMDTLHFLSKTLRIEGEVTNSNDSPFAGIEITTGDSMAEFDSSLFPQNDLSQWSSVEAGEAVAEQAFLIDITERGALTGSQITALVTDAGGGVRHAGSILADRQDFSLTTDGRIVIDGGETIAAIDVRYEGRTIEVTGEVPSGLADTELESEVDMTTMPDDSAAGFRTGVNNLFPDLQELPQDINDNSDLVLDIDDIDSDDFGIDTETRAVFNAANGSIELVAMEGDISIEAAILSSNLGINLDAPEAINFDSVQIFSNAAIDWEATSITINSSDDRSFIAANGPLSLTATDGAITLEGARLQGTVTENSEEDEEDIELAVSLNAQTDILLSSLDEDNLTVIFGVDGDVNFESGGDIRNHTGRIVSNGDIRFVAGGNIENIVAFPNGTRDPLILQGARTGALAWWTGFTQGRSIRETVIDYGDFDIEGQLAFITATENVELIAGGDIQNIGGQINANNGDVSIQASNVFSEGVVSGVFEYSRRCLILCSSSGNSTLNVSGGLINAGGELRITANDSIENRGGFFVGLEGVDLEAKRVLFESVFLPQIVDRPGGLYNFWSGHSAWVYWRDVLGGVFTDDKDIKVNGADEIVLRGVMLENLISDIDPTIIYEPRQIGNANEQTIGFFRELKFILGSSGS